MLFLYLMIALGAVALVALIALVVEVRASRRIDRKVAALIRFRLRQISAQAEPCLAPPPAEWIQERADDEFGKPA